MDFSLDLNAGYIYEDSDDDRCRADDASSDEEDGLPSQFKQRREKRTDKGKSALERELDSELDVRMGALRQGVQEPNTGSKNRAAHPTKEDDGDSDQDFGPHMTNDELLYDPRMDDEDQAWVDMQKRKNKSVDMFGLDMPEKETRTTDPNVSAAPNSDAILSCPACMTVLCFDCQRHDLYETQFRAMFVVNCNIESGETLHYPEPGKKKKNQRRYKKSNEKEQSWTNNNPGETVNPVKCTECETVVAVYDSDEIYHFFNVISAAVE
eukprot:m.25639 g.25639  ORF g.25639 m.25639 type:complete len:266 (+) comp7725_c0_seq4:273-1070(+)